MSFLSSQYQLCSQSQKMSIGIVVDSVPRPRNESRREDEVSGAHGEKEVSNAEQLMRKPKLQRGVKASSTVTTHQNAQEGSVWVAAGLFGAKVPVKDTEHTENQAVRQSRSSLQGKQPACMMTQSFVNEASKQPDVAKKPAAERVAGKENMRPSNDDVSEKFSSGPKQKVPLPAKKVLQEQPNKLENCNKEVLRMKLREILGNVASGNNMLGISRTPEVKGNETVKQQTAKGDSQSKPRQNSDTIETDSENGEDVKAKRPVTRSLTRKKAPTRKRLRNSKPKSTSSDKKDHQGSDIFSFADKTPPQSRAVNRDSSIFKKYDRAKKNCGVKSKETLSRVTDWRNVLPEKTGCDKAPPVEEISLRGGAKSPKHNSLNANLEPEAAMQNTNINQSPVKKNQQPDVESPASQEKAEHLKTFGRQSSVPHADVLDSIWFKWTKDFPTSPMRSNPQTLDKGHNVHGYAQPEGGIPPKAKCLSKSSTTPEKDNSESTEDEASLKNARCQTPESSTEEEDDHNGNSTPVRGQHDNTEEVSSSKKEEEEKEEENEEEEQEADEEEDEEGEDEEEEEEVEEEEEEEDVHTSSEIRVARKPRLFRSKRHCNHDDFSTFTPTLPTPKESGNADDALAECLDESPEDGLSRVVSLLGLALEKVKKKLMLVTNKRCSEILVSAAGEIQSQLQNVETQIQTDLGKLTSLKTSKRKHVEIRLQEQQEHLKRMHEKFKEEICQYLQDCKGAMEGLETQHMELQRAIERQKALHRKLLSQTEAAVETHLTDAQKQMMIVRKLGKQKMQQFKAIIAECLKDGISR